MSSSAWGLGKAFMILNYMFHSTAVDCLGLALGSHGFPTYWLSAFDEVRSFLRLNYPACKIELVAVVSVCPPEGQSRCHQSVGAWPILSSDEETVVGSREGNVPGVPGKGGGRAGMEGSTMTCRSGRTHNSI